MGHGVGDELLKEVSKRLNDIEGAAIYRLSGDEFAFLFEKYNDMDNFKNEVSQVLEKFIEPFKIQGKTLIITASVGVSVFIQDGETREKLIQNADTALFSAKDEGKSRIIFYTQIMSDEINKKMEIESILRRAIKDDLIKMYLQPQCDVQTKKIKGFESLMRIILEDGTFISPIDFIPVAEETGIICQLGKWALEDAFIRAKRWIEIGHRDFYISVNVSGVQFKNCDFVNTAKIILEKFKISPEYVELEITESTLMEDTDTNIGIMNELRSLGFKIALDDFGTGYSSFQYLRKIPMDTLKIDKSFVDNIEENKKAEGLVKQMIDMAHDLDFKVIAEGVENQEQYNILLNTSLELIQGYYFSRPLSPNDVESLMDTF